MKKTILLRSIIIITFLFAPQISFTQSFSWVKQIGTVGWNRGYSLKADNVGNIYVTGSFESTALFDSVNVKSKGERDIFVAKYSDSGNLIWVKTAGGIGYDEGSSLKLDAKGENLVVTGFMENAQFEDTTLSGSPFFVARYNTAGHLKWVKGIKTDGGGSETSTAIDTSGNTFVTGGSYGHTVLDTFVVSGPYFIAKYDQTGTVKWVRSVVHTHYSIDIQPCDINCDFLNNVYVIGYIQNNTIRFDSTHFLVPQMGGNLFLVKYDKEGNVVWAIQSDNTEIAYSSSISFDAQNNIYLTGNFTNNIKFDSIALEGNNQGTAFLVKYSPNGNAIWATKVEGLGYSNGCGITIDNKGNIYITGVASDTSRFGDIEMLHGGIFAAKYDLNGKCVFAASAGSIPADHRSWGRDIAVTDSNKIFLTGHMSGDVHFGPIIVSNNNGESIFITKLSIDPPAGVEQISSNLTTYVLNQNYPNPFNPLTTISFKIPQAAFVSLNVYNIFGQVVATLASENISAGQHARTWNAINVASGVYFYRLRTGGYSETKKLILQK